LSGKVLVVYYSRAGTTEKIAKEIAGRLSEDIEEIVDKKIMKVRRREGIASRLSARKWIWLSLRLRLSGTKFTEIEEPKREPSLYDLVVIGTPVWNGTISTPIRTYISRFEGHFQDIATFCTHSLAKDNKALGDMEALIGKRPLASLKLRRKEQVETGEYIHKVEEFVEQLRSKHGGKI